MKLGTLTSLLVGSVGVLLALQNSSKLDITNRRLDDLRNENSNLNKKLEMSRERIKELEDKLQHTYNKSAEEPDKMILINKVEESAFVEDKALDNEVNSKRKRVETTEFLKGADTDAVAKDTDKNESTVTVEEDTEAVMSTQKKL